MELDNFKEHIKNYNLISILGPTAVGKTSFAAYLAKIINSEIISADSRQVYKKMDLGTGKDLDDYVIDNQKIKYYLIDILDAGEKYNVFQFQKDFFEIYNEIFKKKITPIMCGGTGLYLDAIIQNYDMQKVPENLELRNELEKKTLSEISDILKSLKNIHNVTDIDTKKRAIRAIEIEIFQKTNLIKKTFFPKINSFNIGISLERQLQKHKITERLKQRLQNGMIQEVENLLENGVASETLLYYGLEYKFITLYLLKEITYNEMFEKLNIAIHQFSKRQMTWYRKMENQGVKILWVDGILSNEEKLRYISDRIKKSW